ncbi:hypothetical protein [Micromonospora thermarum]|uniref:Uncharacterized protein n=1 Tax=Micromonospora thermarum TaxID=2720024 RepID=A0ABX0ZF70_9ACTN|nr:hypothetical protein [Micromonospora thermarum]NJP35194.1 hypothetical protein [Micromonospora thermarum]
MRYAHTTWQRLRYAIVASYLALAAGELILIGGPGLVGALTFSGQLTAVGLLVAGVVAFAGSIAAVFLLVARQAPRRHRAERRRRQALLTIGLAALTVLVANLMILITQLAVGDLSATVAIWSAFALVSAVVLTVLVAELDKTVPLPRKVAVGALVTGVIAVTNFAYSQLYLPSKQEAAITTTPAFGTPRLDADGKGVSIPFSVEFVVGGQPVYVLAATYAVTGREAELARTPRSMSQLNTDVGKKFNPSVTTEAARWQPVEAGVLIAPQSRLRPGDTMRTDRFVRIPAPMAYDSVDLDLHVEYVRADRARLDTWPSYSENEDNVTYEWALTEASGLHRWTRRPVVISTVWSYRPAGDGTFYQPDVRYRFQGDDRDRTTSIADRYGGYKTSHNASLPLTHVR